MNHAYRRYNSRPNKKAKRKAKKPDIMSEIFGMVVVAACALYWVVSLMR